MTLDDHLHACMREINRIPSAIGAKREFHAALQRDPKLRADAVAKLAALPDAVTMKCHISRVHRAALEEVLKDA